MHRPLHIKRIMGKVVGNGFILQQLEQVCKGKKANLLTAWVKYITSLLDLTRDCLALKGLDNMSSV